MKIGNLDLGNLPLFLAPMEDVTYKSFRYPVSYTHLTLPTNREV